MKASFLTLVFLLMVPAVTLAQDAEETNPWTIAEGDKSIDIMVTEKFTNRMFVIRCEAKRTYAFIVWSEFVGTTPQVEYRTDKLPPKEQYWKSGTDGGSSFFPSRTVEFLKKMEGSTLLTAKVTPIGKAPITAEFDITGIEEALAPIRKACRWK